MAKRFGKFLVDMGSPSTRSRSGRCSRSRSALEGELLGKVAIRLGLVTEDQVLKALVKSLA